MLHDAYVQAYDKIEGQCFRSLSQLGSGRQAEMLTVEVCLNAKGIDVTREEDGSVVMHGRYVGWSRTDGAFGFVNGTSCTTGGLFNKVTVQRTSRVTLGCCSAVAVYVTRMGEQGSHAWVGRGHTHEWAGVIRMGGQGSHAWVGRGPVQAH